MARFSLLVALAALVLAFFALTREQPGLSSEADVTGEELEVAIYMGRIQRYHQKWWAAARAGNAELADFYLHEMEEAMAEIADAALVDEGVDVSGHMRIYGLQVVEAMERTLKEEGLKAMHSQGEMLVNACNSCHRVTGHPYIRIRVPGEVDFSDQEFAPLP